MARACRFTTPYGSRNIWHDGKPFIRIEREVDRNENGPRPVDVDDVAREIKKLLCGERKSKSQLAGIFDFLKRKKKRHPMSRRIYFVPSPSGRMGRARRKRRRR